MSEVVSRAKAVWEGDLFHGKGQVSFDSGALPTKDVTWAARSSKVPGMTSPEELLAAAHASCFAMALSNILAKEGKPATRLEVTADAVFAKTDEGFRITEVRLNVVGQIPGMSQDGFQKAASMAGDGCPVSKALKGNVKITVSAKLV
ncbi:MAG: OsmC family peroxiredoxin [Candidatus Caldarchaeum sp.]|nr:OsmC family peroxiredoxin [Candidatus Caldarchaeum sp.]MCS7133367.1 OsmC family peroxiredoxin [Candidatus Caldarchaeum sp.]MCX8202113.1 OsmC family peroxiredoxin [Candidatus Caldarchaeum sp.]MDW8063151.1 OsmC family peroxiredoxin [Candidatus Caldarchaeum sp.]MDW8435243.1 OsmC family peroxiredoxin [Candidatus Caldarchaeum sp.]